MGPLPFGWIKVAEPLLPPFFIFSLRLGKILDRVLQFKQLLGWFAKVFRGPGTRQ
jgi:hypothetical protein